MYVCVLAVVDSGAFADGELVMAAYSAGCFADQTEEKSCADGFNCGT